MSFNNFYNNTINEQKMSIQRFNGSNEMSDGELLTFLHQLQGVASSGSIDLNTNDKVSMTEKFDGSPTNWGLNPEFFIESASSGEVTSENIEKFNNPYTIHFYKAFKFLSEYAPFIERLNKAQSYADEPIKFTSEMFPVLTHKGNECGDFIFCSTKYNRSKLGNSGSFMVFDVKVKKGDSWVEADDDIHDMLIDIVRSPEDPEWKVYYIERDGKLNGTLQFEFSGINDWISSPEKLASSISLLKKRNDSNTKNLKDLIRKIRPGLQQQLDIYAEKTSSSLGNSDGISPIEGVVLKVTLPDGPTFIKGTSQIFKDISAGTWGTRKELGLIEKTLTGKFLKDIIGLRTDQPAALNRAIVDVGNTFHSNNQGEERINEFTDELRKKLQIEGYVSNDKDARLKADNYLNAANKQLVDIEQQWQQTKTTVDPDTIDKTESQMTYTKEMLKELRTRVIDTRYSGNAYIVYLLRMLIGRRIEEIVNPSSGDTTDKLKELDASKVIARVKQMMPKSTHIKPSNVVPFRKSDTEDNLTDGGTSDINIPYTSKGIEKVPAGQYAVRSAYDDLDDNLTDQDPEWIDKPKNNAIDLNGQEDEIWKRAVAYVSGNDDTDPSTWEESYEVFDEDELLDERKFEKVKMARNVLSKLGHSKAYGRNEQGKYILRSKHIKKLMKKLGYTFIDMKARWIMDTQTTPEKKPEVATNEPEVMEPSTDNKPETPVITKNAIIWVGRAQPWHKGHDVLVQRGLDNLGGVGANMIFIMLVKGTNTSTDIVKNPMDFNAQFDLISSVYKNENAVDISSLPVSTGSIVDILVNASKQGIIVKGWVAGSDRIAGYKKQFELFKTDKYKSEFEQKTSPGTPYPIDGDIQFIDVGREEETGNKPITKDAKALASVEKATKQDAIVSKANTTNVPTISIEEMSGSLARSLVSKLDFTHWFKEICPEKYALLKSTQLGYQEAYNIIRRNETQDVHETYNESTSLKQSLSDIFFRR